MHTHMFGFGYSNDTLLWDLLSDKSFLKEKYQQYDATINTSNLMGFMC